MLRKVRLLVLMMCTAAMMMAMATSVFAVSANDPAYYIAGSPDAFTSAIKVKLVIDTKEEDWVEDSALSEVFDVTVSSDMDGVTGLTVRDALLAWKAQEVAAGNTIQLYDADFHNDSLVAYGSSSTLFYALDYGSYSYVPTLPMEGTDWALDGFSMRINGRFPLITDHSETWDDGPEGTYAYQTPIHDGDVIHFYWNYPYNETQTTYYSANFISADTSYDSAAQNLSVQLTRSFDYQDAYNRHWYINSFVNSTDVPAGSYAYTIWGEDQNGNTVSVKTGTVAIGSTGSGTISLESAGLTSGETYYLQIETQSYKDCLQLDEYDDIYIVDNTKVMEKFTA